MSDTVSSDSVAQDQLRAFIERIERMEEEKKAIADDIREIYLEAKGNGFSVPVLREIVKIRKQDHAERLEREALLDLYMAALGMQAEPRFGFDDDDPPPRGSRSVGDHRPAALEMPRQQVVGSDQFQAKPSEGKAGAAPLIVAPPDGDASRTSRGVDIPAIIPPQPETAGLPEAAASGDDSPETATQSTAALTEVSSGQPESSARGANHLVPNDAHKAALDEAHLQAGIEPGPSIPKSARLKTTDEVADDMGLPAEVHPGCQKPKVCSRFSHTGLCATCRGEQAVAA